MEPIDMDKKKELEGLLGFEICPLTVVEERSVSMFGVYRGAEVQTAYGCSEICSTLSVIQPCTAEYAKTCPLYRHSGAAAARKGK